MPPRTTQAPLTPAQKKLVEDHLHIVSYLATEVITRVPASVQREDLISAGNLALAKAAQRYDNTRGTTFSQYARLRVRGEIIDELRRCDWLSRGQRSTVNTFNQVTADLSHTLGREPTNEEVSRVTGIDLATINTLTASHNQQPVSVNNIPDEVYAPPIPQVQQPENAYLSKELLEHLRHAVHALDDRRKHVIIEIFYRGRTVTDLARELGLTQSRISQLVGEAASLLHLAMSHHYHGDQTETSPSAVRERRRQAFLDRVAASLARPTSTPACA